MDVALGLDYGGTHLKAGLVSREGRLRFLEETPSRAERGAAGVRHALAEATDLLISASAKRGWRAVAVGLGFPGLIAGRSGRVLNDPANVRGAQGLALASFLRRRLGLPASVENDASAAAYGEARVGAGRRRDTVLLATVGTGLGGGLVIGGRIQRGPVDSGGEIGHMVHVPDGLACPHGGRGCLELYASATALVRVHAEAGGGRLAPRAIVAAASAGDGRARSSLATIGRHLGLGLASAALVVGPDVVIIGGGLIGAGELLLGPAREAFTGQVFAPLAAACPLVPARLGNAAGVVGAGLLAFSDPPGAPRSAEC